jgi:hypothetical protein
MTSLFFEEDECIKLPPPRKCACSMLCLICATDVKKAFKNKPFRKNYQNTLGKLQILFNRQSHSAYFSEKVKKHLGSKFKLWSSFFLLFYKVCSLLYLARPDGTLYLTQIDMLNNSSTVTNQIIKK